jgi:hypothetical protein
MCTPLHMKLGLYITGWGGVGVQWNGGDYVAHLCDKINPERGLVRKP